MRIRSIALVIALFAGSFALAKGKKDILPPYVLTAQTVSVVIDPDSGIDPDDPRANEIARKDVEAAILKWGRLEPIIAGQPADLIIVIRRGQKRTGQRDHPRRSPERPQRRHQSKRQRYSDWRPTRPACQSRGL